MLGPRTAALRTVRWRGSGAVWRHGAAVGRRHVHAHAPPDVAESLQLLGLDAVDDVVELRAAYRSIMRRVHPDVAASSDSGDGADTTAAAARVNAAYACLLEALTGDANGARSPPAWHDAFDIPGEACCLFVDPFRCGVDPLRHAELQAAVETRVAAGEAAYEALSALRLPAVESAAFQLSPGQRDAARRLLQDMEATLEFEMTAWLLDDSLRRAQRANARWGGG